MTDNLEIHSTASSDISESLREQILGKAYTRRRLKRSSTTATQSQDTIYESYELIPSKDSPFEIVLKPKDDTKSGGGDNKSLSYHTPLTGSERSMKKESGFVVVPRDPVGNEKSRTKIKTASMKALDDRRYTTIETQTVAIQTIATGTDTDFDCKCWEDEPCTCENCECESRKQRIVTPVESTDFSNYTETSSQTVDINVQNYCSCKCRTRWNEELPATDQFSDSDDSYTTDFFDLPYQNNEDYLKLLRELEKKLIARNRDRVRRTMMEFERRSRQNQNLDKPICDYSDDSASMLRKLSAKPTKAHKNKKKNSVCYKCGRNKRINSDILQNEKKWDEMNFVQSVVENDDVKSPPVSSRIERSLHKSHWQLDPRSGEWVKVACFQHTDFSRASPPVHPDYIKEDYKKLPPNGNMCKKECCCRQKKRH